MMLAGFCYRGTSVVIPTYFEQSVPFLNDLINSFSFIKLTGTKTLAATILTSIVYFVGIFGMMAGGRVADKMDLRLGYFLFHLFSLPFLILMTQFTNTPFFIFTIGYLFFSLGMQPIENSLVAHLTPEKLRSTSYGVKFIFTFGIGSLSVFSAKSIVKNYSIVYVFRLQVIVILVLLLTITLLAAITRNKEFRN
jgi:predicted MFS family arabinose efflux permease